jgi:hypothetical protein
MSGKKVVMFGVVMLEAPVDAGNLQVCVAGTAGHRQCCVNIMIRSVTLHAADVSL